MKHNFRISTLSIVSVLCAVMSMPAFAASSVRSLGGAGTYSSAASAATAKSGGTSVSDGATGATRVGAARTTSGSGSLSNTRVSSSRAAATPRLSIGRYLAGTSAATGSVSKPIVGGSSVDVTEVKNEISDIKQDLTNVVNNIDDIKNFVGFENADSVIAQLERVKEKLQDVDSLEFDEVDGRLTVNGVEINVSGIQDVTDLEERLTKIEDAIQGLDSVVEGYVNSIVGALLEGKADKTDLASKAEQSELDELSARVEGLEVMSSGGLQAPAGTGMYVYDADKKSWESLTVVVEDAQTNVITNN